MLPKCCQAIKNGLPDMPPMTPARFNKAKRRFTPEAVEKIREALQPPADFDLHGRLWRAVHLYHYVSEPDNLECLPDKSEMKRDKLAEVEEKTAQLLSLVQDAPGVLLDICNDDPGLKFLLETCLEDLLKRCHAQIAELPKERRGRPHEDGHWGFFLEVAKIHTEATGRPATRRFYRLCFNSLIGSIGDDNLVRYAKGINRNYYKTA